ncbi:MAG: AI-2E family transporter [Chloroflexi bacterium]|nr:AI-2E family transporter [Chloroflexota bacterium]
MRDSDKRVIKIAPETILLTVIAVFGVYLLLMFLAAVRLVIVIFLMAVVIAQAVEPLVRVLIRLRIHRGIAVILAYLMLLQIFLLIGAIVVPSLIVQLQGLVINLPILLTQLEALLGAYYAASQLVPPEQLQEAVNQLATRIAELLPSLLLLPFQIGSVVFAAIMTLVISAYWLIMADQAKALIIGTLPVKARAEGEDVLAEIGMRVGGWVRGQLLLSVSIGLITFIGLELLNVPFTLVLSVWAAITELIPIAGPIIGAIPALIIALLISPLKALLVLILYVVVQQLESHLLVPNVMSREVGLNPLLVILALLAGAELMGIVGALLAVPLTAALQVLVFHGARLLAAARET